VGQHQLFTTDNAPDYTLAEHWNGSTWTKQSTTGAPSGRLFSVACESASKCEAVGQAASGGTLAMGLSGTKWVTQTTPNVLSGSSALNSVACYTGGCTAVGASGTHALAEVWNGSKWALQSRLGAGDPAGSVDAAWNGVQCHSASSCTAVGEWQATSAGSDTLTLAEHWSGSTWTVAHTPSPAGYDVLTAVSCTSTLCTAVGWQNAVDAYGDSANSLAMRN